MRNAVHPGMDEVSVTDVMSALSDPIRMGIIRVLSDGVERGWSELRAPVAKSTLSHHLSVLRAAGLTRAREEGTRCFVVLRREEADARFPGLLDVVIAAADRDDVGSQVGLALQPSGPPTL